jgi:branched-chain amino acid transport system substrate-binding protein
MALRRAVLAIVFACLLAGCGDDESQSGGGKIAGLSISSCAPAEYEGDGDPTALIVSDLPMRGDSADRSSQQVEAIRLVLERRNWKAAGTAIAFQPCDDSIEKTGLWDAKTCRANANAYAADRRVLGVIGTYNSGCAAEEIPVLNRRGLAMVSPGNTAVCLTQSSPICEDGQPDSLYPSGKRNYARVVPNDAFQGAALAEFARREGVRAPFVLYAADDPTSTGQAQNFRGAAEALGLEIAGFETWDPDAEDYSGLMAEVKRSGADAVVLAGLTEQNGGQVIKDKVEVVGSNADVPLIAYDGLAQQSTIEEAGAAARGMFASVPGSTPENLSGQGAAFASDLAERFEGDPVEQFAPYAGEAAAVLLDAIAKAGTDRDAVTKAVLSTRGGGGILDSYEIGPSGDPNIGPATVLKAAMEFETFREVTPPDRLVRAARR